MSTEEQHTTEAQPNRFARKIKEVEPASTKNLRIKTNSLKRTIKDLDFAKKEVARETERLDEISATQPDRIPQQKNVLDEANMMVPHSENRIRTAVKDLSDFLEKEGNLADATELVETARAAIEEANTVLADG